MCTILRLCIEKPEMKEKKLQRPFCGRWCFLAEFFSGVVILACRTQRPVCGAGCAVQGGWHPRRKTQPVSAPTFRKAVQNSTRLGGCRLRRRALPAQGAGGGALRVGGQAALTIFWVALLWVRLSRVSCAKKSRPGAGSRTPGMGWQPGVRAAEKLAQSGSV